MLLKRLGLEVELEDGGSTGILKVGPWKGLMIIYPSSIPRFRACAEVPCKPHKPLAKKGYIIFKRERTPQLVNQCPISDTVFPLDLLGCYRGLYQTRWALENLIQM